MAHESFQTGFTLTNGDSMGSPLPLRVRVEPDEVVIEPDPIYRWWLLLLVLVTAMATGSLFYAFAWFGVIQQMGALQWVVLPGIAVLAIGGPPLAIEWQASLCRRDGPLLCVTAEAVRLRGGRTLRVTEVIDLAAVTLPSGGEDTQTEWQLRVKIGGGLQVFRVFWRGQGGFNRRDRRIFAQWSSATGLPAVTVRRSGLLHRGEIEVCVIAGSVPEKAVGG